MVALNGLMTAALKALETVQMKVILRALWIVMGPTRALGKAALIANVKALSKGPKTELM